MKYEIHEGSRLMAHMVQQHVLLAAIPLEDSK